MEPKIQLLMLTYNGATYLKEQLESIFAQDFSGILSLLVRDDGSSDDTILILKEYSARYHFRVLYGENVGINKSMELLLNEADYTCDYYAYCDQDDIWMKDKLSTAIDQLTKENTTIPLLYSCRTQLVHTDLSPIGLSPLPKGICDFYNAVVQNIFPGHTMVFNHALWKLLKGRDLSQAKMYDWWTYLTVSAFGKIIYDPVPHVFYRQHNSNAVGFELNPLKLFFMRLRRMKKKGRNAISIQAKSFYEQYKNQLPTEYQKELENLICCTKRSKRLKIAILTKFHRQTFWETIEFKALFLWGKYKIK